MKKRFLIPLLCMGVLLSGCGGDSGVTMEEAKVSLPEYSGIPVTVTKPSVTDEEVASEAETILYSYNQSNALDRTVVEEGDTVSATIYLYDQDGEEFTDNSLSSGFITAGQGTTYAELEAGIVGMSCGETKTISFMLPDPYIYNETLSGTQASAEVTVRYIKNPEEISLATMTDEQAEAVLPGSGSVFGFYDQVRENLLSQDESTSRQEAYEAICSYLLENSTVDPFPGAELAARTDEYLKETAADCEEYYDMSMDAYYEMLGTTEKDFRTQVEASISDTIRLELIFTAIGDAEGISYTQSDYEAYLQELMSSWNYTSEDELYEQYGQDYLEQTFRIETIIDWLIDHAEITYGDSDALEETVSEDEASAESSEDGTVTDEKTASEEETDSEDGTVTDEETASEEETEASSEDGTVTDEGTAPEEEAEAAAAAAEE